MRRAGGVFVGVFLVTGAAQAVIGFIPALPSAPALVAAEKPTEPVDKKFTGTGKGIRAGSLPKARWEELINEWGNKCPSLTPAILAAQLHQESIGFKVSVVEGRQDSPVGARGIAQFMPATWAGHGLDANGDGRRDILDPEDAIPSAASYDCAVARDVRNVPGDLTANMLAAYNAGSHAVKKYQGVPPYKETQGYVKDIKRKAGGYEQ
jgi:soluble lytic murein transglycosylase-like protein